MIRPIKTINAVIVVLGLGVLGIFQVSTIN